MRRLEPPPGQGRVNVGACDAPSPPGSEGGDCRRFPQRWSDLNELPPDARQHNPISAIWLAGGAVLLPACLPPSLFHYWMLGLISSFPPSDECGTLCPFPAAALPWKIPAPLPASSAQTALDSPVQLFLFLTSWEQEGLRWDILAVSCSAFQRGRSRIVGCECGEGLCRSSSPTPAQCRQRQQPRQVTTLAHNSSPSSTLSPLPTYYLGQLPQSVS